MYIHQFKCRCRMKDGRESITWGDLTAIQGTAKAFYMLYLCVAQGWYMAASTYCNGSPFIAQVCVMFVSLGMNAAKYKLSSFGPKLRIILIVIVSAPYTSFESAWCYPE